MILQFFLLIRFILVCAAGARCVGGFLNLYLTNKIVSKQFAYYLKKIVPLYCSINKHHL